MYKTERDPLLKHVKRSTGSSDITISGELRDRIESWRRLGVGGDATSTYDSQDGCPPLEPNIDRFSAAAWYIREALQGTQVIAHIHTLKQLKAVGFLRSRNLSRIFTCLCFFHLLLPFMEYPLGTETDWKSLYYNWRPTMLGSSCIELGLCIVYMLEIFCIYVIRDRCSGQPFWKTNGWAALRLCLVTFQLFDISVFIGSRYAGVRYDWPLMFRWSRCVTPFIVISAGTYRRFFLSGLIRVLPRLLPVGLLAVFIMSFYAFIGFILFNHTRVHSDILQQLELFATLPTSMVTMLRLAMSIPFILDLEILYKNSTGIILFSLSYAIATVLVLYALVTSIANNLSQQQHQESYKRIMAQRTRALSLAFTTVADDHGCVPAYAWFQIMKRLRPSVTEHECGLLIEIACTSSGSSLQSFEDTSYTSEARFPYKISLDRPTFFQLCALTEAHITGENVALENGLHHTTTSTSFTTWLAQFSPDFLRKILKKIGFRAKKCRRFLNSVYFWGKPFCVSPRWIVFHILVLLQGVQLVMVYTVREGPMTPGQEFSANVLGPFLGNVLLTLFWVDACVFAFTHGISCAYHDWTFRCNFILNVIGLVHSVGYWPKGMEEEKTYALLASLRVLCLWNVLSRLQDTLHSSDVAKRLVLVIPSLLKCLTVLFAVVYAWSVVAYGLLWNTPIGIGGTASVKDDALMKRWMLYSHVIGFDNFGMTFLSMIDVMLLSNWTLFMDAAADVTRHPALATSFFYVYKMLLFYYIQPVVLGFTVQSYMSTVVVPEAEVIPEGLLDDVSEESSLSDEERSLDGEEAADVITDKLAYIHDRAGADMHADGGDTHITVNFPPAKETESALPVLSRRARVGRRAQLQRTLSHTFWGAQRAAEKRVNDANALQSEVRSLHNELKLARETSAKLRKQLYVALMKSEKSGRSNSVQASPA